MKDSINFLDHINGKNHQKNMGMSMKTKKSTLEDVKARFAFKKLESKFFFIYCLYVFIFLFIIFSEEQEKKIKVKEELLQDLHEEEAKLRDSKKDKKKDERKRKHEPVDEGDLDPDLAAMMGFGGFGGSKK